jgi:hypothetical protein
LDSLVQEKTTRTPNSFPQHLNRIGRTLWIVTDRVRWAIGSSRQTVHKVTWLIIDDGAKIHPESAQIGAWSRFVWSILTSPKSRTCMCSLECRGGQYRVLVLQIVSHIAFRSHKLE